LAQSGDLALHEVLARFAYRHRWMILALWVVLFLGMNVARSQTFGTAYANTFSLPGTNSTHALKLLQSGFKSKSGDVDEIVFHAKTGHAREPRAAILATLANKKLPEVAPSRRRSPASSPFVGIGALQISKNGKIAYSVVYFKSQGYCSEGRRPTGRERRRDARSSSLKVNFGGNAFEQLRRPPAAPTNSSDSSSRRSCSSSPSGRSSPCCCPWAWRSSPSASPPPRRRCSVTALHRQLRADPRLLIGLGVGIDYALFIVTRVDRT
jgi:putative drug exporter of the RND superfamily